MATTAEESVSKTTNEIEKTEKAKEVEEGKEKEKEVQKSSVNVDFSSADKEKENTTKPAGGGENEPSSKPEEGGGGYYPEEEITEGAWNVPRVEVKPVQIVTGEEEEEATWKNRAKLYRWSPNKEKSGGGEWKERGLGEAKLLQHLKTKKVRFLLRQEKTHKIVANHYVIQRDVHCKLTPNVGSDKIWVWTVKDYAEDPPKIEQFALKFAQVDQAQLFKEKFDEAAKQNDAIGLGKKTNAKNAQTTSGNPTSTEESSDKKEQEKAGGDAKEEKKKEETEDKPSGEK